MIVLVPVIVFSSTTIENDLPVAVFIFAHYCILIEVFNKRGDSSYKTREWMLLAGILCGGAVGHKLNALFVATTSTVLVFATDFYYSKKDKTQKLLSPFWLIGMTIVTVPWFLRTYILTGNPVYPFLCNIFGSTLPDTFHSGMEKVFLNTQGTLSLVNYFKDILLGYGSYNEPKWGPTILFIVLAGPFLKKNLYPLGFRLCIVTAVLSMITQLTTTEIRYHIGLLLFITCIPFALIWNLVSNRKIIKWLTIVTVGFCLWVVYSISGVRIMLYSSFNMLLSGNSPGNYRSIETYVDNMRWMSYIINTRTQKDEAFLYAGIEYGYGLNRKIFYSSGYDKEMIGELARKSSDANALRENIRNLGVNHILLKTSFYDKFKNHPVSEFRIQEAEFQKIREMIDRYMKLRFATSDNTIFWYSFRTEKEYPQIILKRGDAQEFPIKFLDEVHSQFQSKNIELGREMLRIASETSMSSLNKINASILYDVICKNAQPEEIKSKLISAIREYPNQIDLHFKLGVIYNAKGKYGDAIRQFQKALKLDPNSSVAHTNLGHTYRYIKKFEEAMQCYAKAIRQSPYDSDLYIYLGDTYYALKDYENALKAYQKAIDLKPYCSTGYYNMGVIYDIQMQYDKAIQHYLKTIEINPKYVYAYDNLGRIYAIRKEYGKAQEIYRKAIALK